MMTISSLKQMVRESIYNATGQPRAVNHQYNTILNTDDIWWKENSLMSIAEFSRRTDVSIKDIYKAIPIWVRTRGERIYLDEHAFRVGTQQEWLEVENKRLTNRRVIHRVGRFYVEKAERNGCFVYTFFYTNRNKLGIFSSVDPDEGDSIAAKIFSSLVVHTKTMRQVANMERVVRLTMQECVDITSGIIPKTLAEKARSALLQMREKTKDKKYKLEDK